MLKTLDDEFERYVTSVYHKQLRDFDPDVLRQLKMAFSAGTLVAYNNLYALAQSEAGVPECSRIFSEIMAQANEFALSIK